MKKLTNLAASASKLTLNKKTISNLKSTEMNRLIGGTHYQSWCHCGTGYTKNRNTCPGHKTC